MERKKTNCISLPITYYSNNIPCKDCKDRYIDCHSECSKYAEYKKQLDVRKDKR